MSETTVERLYSQHYSLLMRCMEAINALDRRYERLNYLNNSLTSEQAFEILKKRVREWQRGLQRPLKQFGQLEDQMISAWLAGPSLSDLILVVALSDLFPL